MDPRKLNAMMRQLGIDVKELPDVKRVVIETPTKEYVFTSAEVTVMKAQGSTTYQVVGSPKITDKGGAVAKPPATPAAAPSAPRPAGEREEPESPKFTDDDVKLVMEQAKAPRDKAVKALEDSDGEPAAAILKLLEGS